MKSFKIQYPPQKGIYKLVVKNSADWTAFNVCRLQISVGQNERHEGDKFKSTLDWAKDRFEKVVVCVNDTLQRFNLIDKGMNKKTAYAMAYEAGTKWIERNISKTDASKIEIYRWDYWLNNPDFIKNKKLIMEKYKTDKEFKDSIEKEVFSFLSRKGLENDEYQNALSRAYFLEETAVFPLMFNKHKAADIYPGKMLLPVQLMEQGKIKEINFTGNVVFTRIDFLKNTKTPE